MERKFNEVYFQIDFLNDFFLNDSNFNLMHNLKQEMFLLLMKPLYIQGYHC